MKPYYEDESVTLYHGDALELLPLLPRADAIVTDPPYGETSLDWDKWPDGWPAAAALVAPQMWCFGSMRMFFDKRDDLTGWKLAGGFGIRPLHGERNNRPGCAAARAPVDRLRTQHRVRTAATGTHGTGCACHLTVRQGATDGLPAGVQRQRRELDRCVGLI